MSPGNTAIVAVDDSVTMRKVLEMTFAATEFEVTVCDSAAAAVEQVKAIKPPLVIADVSLPPTDGYELCVTLKAAAPSTAVLMMASKHNPFDAAKGAQADGHINKPFDTQVMLDRCRELVAAAPDKAEAAPVAQAAAGGQPMAAKPAMRPRFPSGPRPQAEPPANWGQKETRPGPGPMPRPMARPAPGKDAPVQARPPVARSPQPPAGKPTPVWEPPKQPAAAGATPTPRPAAPAQPPAAKTKLRGGTFPGVVSPAVEKQASGRPAASARAPVQPKPRMPERPQMPGRMPTPRTKPEPPDGRPTPKPMAARPASEPAQPTPEPAPVEPVSPFKPLAAPALKPDLPGESPAARRTTASWTVKEDEKIPPMRKQAADEPADDEAESAVAQAAEGMEAKLQDLGLTPDQVAGVLALSREVIEQVVWEVVPTLAEVLIKEEIARLTKD